MSAIDKAKTVIEIGKVAADIYHAFVDRKKQDEKDKRIAQLEEELKRAREKETP